MISGMTHGGTIPSIGDGIVLTGIVHGAGAGILPGTGTTIIGDITTGVGMTLGITAGDGITVGITTTLTTVHILPLAVQVHALAIAIMAAVV